MRKTALFVDFDNVYLDLRRIDPHAAERFATDPGRWLRWFEAGDDAPGERERRVLEAYAFAERQARATSKKLFQAKRGGARWGR